MDLIQWVMSQHLRKQQRPWLQLKRVVRHSDQIQDSRIDNMYNLDHR